MDDALEITLPFETEPGAVEIIRARLHDYRDVFMVEVVSAPAALPADSARECMAAAVRDRRIKLPGSWRARIDGAKAVVH